MIHPDSLTSEQKRYLHRTYGLDAEARARLRSRRRRVSPVLWFVALPALFLLSGALFPDIGPASMLAAILAWIVGIAHIWHRIFSWWLYRSALRDASSSSNELRRFLVWERIGPGAQRAWWLTIWTSAVALLLGAAATGRVFLAGIWLVAFALDLAFARWKDVVVQRELGRIDQVRALPATDPPSVRAVADGGAIPWPSMRCLAYPSRGFWRQAIWLSDSNEDFCIIVAKDDPRKEMAVRWLASLSGHDRQPVSLLQDLYEKTRIMPFISVTASLDNYTIAYSYAQNGNLVVTLKSKHRGPAGLVLPFQGRSEEPLGDGEAE